MLASFSKYDSRLLMIKTSIYMKIYGKQVVETIIDRMCDVCGNTVMVDVKGHKYEEVGELTLNGDMVLEKMVPAII